MLSPFRLYNTASRTVEEFKPLSPPAVTMYCCGPTVYDQAHIGNLRTYVWEDVLTRTLVALGYAVKRVMNITDVGHLTSDADSGEDKMEKGARREGKTARQIADHYTEVFKKDLRALNCREPDVWCRATDHIPEMIALIATLEEKGCTYRTSDGIYFDTAKFPRYCEFARIDVESLKAGSRVDMGEKRSVTDFALWKFSPEGGKRQMEWESPWGVGFPGWHIECSAMSMKYLPLPIDIHCGGQEHVRVHHSNEIAQTEAATGTQFVRYWVHGEWLMFDSGKMSKSEGGTVLLDDLKTRGLSPLAYRMFTFSAHHRSPITFSWEGLTGADNGLRSLKKVIADVKGRAATGSAGKPEDVDKVLSGFWKALCDNLNTPRALAALWEVVRDPAVSDAQKTLAVKRADEVLALGLLDAEVSHTVKVERDGVAVTVISATPPDATLIEDVVAAVLQRRTAKKAKDYSGADRVRADLAARGVDVRDLPGGAVECVIRG